MSPDDQKLSLAGDFRNLIPKTWTRRPPEPSPIQKRSTQTVLSLSIRGENMLQPRCGWEDYFGRITQGGSCLATLG
jgi:hypothetical protein